jgi:anaerobic selenocysteine-containing dehydrogenase
MNPEDIRARSLTAGQVVDLTSHFDDGQRYARRFVVVPYEIPVGCSATYFPEANVLVPIGSTADRSNTPVSKFVRITVTPHVSKTGHAEVVGKFDHDYVDGYGRAKQ